ncbi:hypothetical protein RclHR1_01680006 [Rhizophagus clarus]|uniref:SAM domain-containing protein n=1 Tax=Rhizophagus clarus TaxID=94130 RepID=A0A2Z6QJT7_9GLOM|nr:hypothetical protein RclHR1_01680006 [Rhizophagus clarus]
MSTPTAEHDSYSVENWDTETLIDFLKEQNLKLDDDDLGILRKQKVDGQAFLELTEEKLLVSPYNFPGGPAIKLAKEIKALKEKPKRAFSTYRSLKEVLTKYSIDGIGIGTIRQFPPATYNLEDDDEELVQCIKEIKRRLGNMGTMLADIVGEESTGRVDYAIKTLEELICITEGKLHQVTMGFAQNLVQCENALQVNKKNRKRKSGDAFGEDFDYIYGIVTTASDWYFILFASDGISSTSKDPINIRFSESALKEGSEEEKDLRKNVKRVMEVIVGLLKDRLECVDEEPDRKKARVEGYRSKK